MNSIVGTIMRLVPPQVTSSLVSSLDVSSAAVQLGIGTSVVVLIAGIANRASDPLFMIRLFDLARESDTNSVLRNLPDVARGASPSLVTERGSQLASMLFGHDQSTIEYLVGHRSGLGAFAGNQLMLLAAPLTLGVLGLQINDQGLNISSFTNFVSSEAEKISGILPAGTRSLLSGPSIPSATGTATTKAKRSGMMKDALPLFGLLSLVLMAWSLSGGCNRGQQSAAAAQVEHAAVPAAAPGVLCWLQRNRRPFPRAT
jgi:OmpA-OmpF porin, OOP family